MKYMTFCGEEGRDFAACLKGCIKFVYWLTKYMKYGLWMVVVLASYRYKMGAV
jgi:hypothetical protein